MIVGTRARSAERVRRCRGRRASRHHAASPGQRRARHQVFRLEIGGYVYPAFRTAPASLLPGFRGMLEVVEETDPWAHVDFMEVRRAAGRRPARSGTATWPRECGRRAATAGMAREPGRRSRRPISRHARAATARRVAFRNLGQQPVRRSGRTVQSLLCRAVSYAARPLGRAFRDLPAGGAGAAVAPCGTLGHQAVHHYRIVVRRTAWAGAVGRPPPARFRSHGCARSRVTGSGCTASSTAPTTVTASAALRRSSVVATGLLDGH